VQRIHYQEPEQLSSQVPASDLLAGKQWCGRGDQQQVGLQVHPRHV